MKRNVLVIMVDSLRADHCWGNQRQCQTPALDELRRNATVCSNAFSTASITTTCTTSILTGSYPFVHGINSFVSGRLRPDIPTLAEVFKAQGYHTWAEMTGPLEPMTGLDRGFDEYRYRKYTQWLDTDFGDALISKLTDDQPTPWFGFLHLWEIHYPRRITPEFNHPDYGHNPYERAVSSLDYQLARIFAALGEDTVIVLTGDHGEYLSGNSSANEFVSRLKRITVWLKWRSSAVKRLRQRIMPLLVKTMKRFKQRDNDVFRAWLGHGFHVYDSLVHVPLIFYGPGLFPSQVEINNITSHVDIFPTLVSALGLDCNAPLSGIDLMPFIQQPPDESNERAVYIQASGARGMVEPDSWLASIRTKRYKYVRSWNETQSPEELYDLQHDPGERANLARKQPDVIQAMRSRLDEVMRSAPQSVDVGATAFTPGELDQLTRRLRDLGYVE